MGDVSGSAELVPIDDPLEDPETFMLRERAFTEKDALRRLPYDPRVAAVVIARVAGGTLLRTVLKEYGISWGTIHKWKRSGPYAKEFKEALKEAEELGAQALVEEAVELSDAPVSFPVDAMRVKLQVDSRWKLAEKHAPSKYGKAADEGGSLDWGKVLDAMHAQRGARAAVQVQGPGTVQGVVPSQGGDPI